MQKVVFLGKQVMQYAVAGGIAAIFDLGIFTLCVKTFDLDYRLATVAGFIIGVLVNFTVSNRFVFQRTGRSAAGTLVRQYVTGLAGLAVNLAVMIVLIELMHWEHVVLARIIAIGVGFIVNFTLTKFYAFNDRRVQA